MITINDIIYELCNEMGYSVTKDGYLKEQCGQPMKFNGKDIRYSYDNIFSIDDETEIWFDPMHNLELIENIFKQYVVDLYNAKRIRIVKCDKVQDKYSPKLKLHINIVDENKKPPENRITIETPYLNNIALGYIQVILRDIPDFNIMEEFDNK